MIPPPRTPAPPTARTITIPPPRTPVPPTARTVTSPATRPATSTAARPAVPPALAAAVTAAALAIAGCAATEPATAVPAPVRDTIPRQPSLAATAAAANSATPDPAAPGPEASTRTAPAPHAPDGAVPDPGSIDQRDADAVSAAVLTTMWSIDTATDHGLRDAVLRAAGWLSPAYLADLRTAPPVGTDAAWTTWAAHRARTRPVLTAGHDARPPDTAAQADRQWRLTVTPVGAGGWRGRPLTMTAFVALQRGRRDEPWRVTAVTLR